MAYLSLAVREKRGYRATSRIKGYHASEERAEVATQLRKDKWSGHSIEPDICRLGRGRCQIHILLAIYNLTENARRTNKLAMPRAFSPTMLASDFAKRGGFFESQVREEIDEAIARGLIARKAKEGEEQHQYQLCLSAWPKLPSIREERGSRKPAGSSSFSMQARHKEDDAEDDSADDASEANTGRYEASRTTVVAPKEVKPGSVRFEPKTRYNFAATPVTSIEYQSQAPLRARLTTAGLLVILDAAERKLAAAAAISGNANVAKTGSYEASRVTAVARNGAPAPPCDYMAELAKLKLYPGLPLQKEIAVFLQDTPALLFVRKVQQRVTEMGHKFGTGLLRGIAQDARQMWVFQRAEAEDLMKAPAPRSRKDSMQGDATDEEWAEALAIARGEKQP